MRWILLTLLWSGLALAKAPGLPDLTHLVTRAQSTDGVRHAQLRASLRERRVRKWLVADLNGRKPRGRRCGLGAPPFSAANYCQGDAAKVGVRGLLCGLALNTSASGRDLFARLPKLGFALDSDLGDAWLKASASMRKPHAKVVRYWTRWFDNRSGASNLMDAILLDNGSPAAHRLFRRRLRSSRFDRQTRRGWITISMRWRRAELPTLRLAMGLLKSGTPAWVQRAVVSAFFQDRPSKSAPPPSWHKASKVAQIELRKLARRAQRLKLPKSLRAAVAGTIAGLNS